MEPVKNGSPISWDLETHLIKPGMMAPKMVCLSSADEKGNTALFEREEGLDVAEGLVRDRFSVGHHIFYDLGVLAAERPRILPAIFEALDQGRIHCTKIRQMMIDNAQGELKFIWNEEKGEYKKQNYHLFRLVMRHKGRDIQWKKQGDDIWRLRYNELDGVPLEKWPEDAKSYAIGDSVDTLEVWESQQRHNIDPDEIPGFVSQMQAAWALNLMGTWGFRTDPQAVAEFKEELRIDMEKQIAVCQEYGFRRGGKKRSRNLKVIRDAIAKWYKDHGRQMKLTPKGAIATDREQLTETDHPGLEAVAESVRLEKQLTTYVAALERGTIVPICPNYNPIIETFRTSCSGGMKVDKVPVGMNVQNLPRKGKVRECVIPRPGHVFVFCDYDTLEMLTLGQVCLDLFGYSFISEAAKAGQDFHVALAADMLEVPYDDAFQRYKAGDKEIANARQFCKIGNYGFGGGMGPHAFVSYAKNMAGLIVEPAHAKKLHKGFRRKWREMNDYFNYCSFLCDGGNAEQVQFVRSGMIRGDVPYTATCNGFFQHLAAMGAKSALYAVVKECYTDAGSPMYGCRPWLFAHDEIGMEVPYAAIGPQGAHDAAMRLQQVMVDVMKEWCPDMPIGASPSMSRRWYKGASDIYEKGLLVPVRPEGRGWVPDV
jgi:hypothetical protein